MTRSSCHCCDRLSNQQRRVWSNTTRKAINDVNDISGREEDVSDKKFIFQPAVLIELDQSGQLDCGGLFVVHRYVSAHQPSTKVFQSIKRSELRCSTGSSIFPENLQSYSFSSWPTLTPNRPINQSTRRQVENLKSGWRHVADLLLYDLRWQRNFRLQVGNLNNNKSTDLRIFKNCSLLLIHAGAKLKRSCVADGDAAPWFRRPTAFGRSGTFGKNLQ